MDKIDKLISDYVNHKLDAKINAIENRIMHKPKTDKLGIRTAYHGGSEQESYVLNKELLENDDERNELIRQKETIDFFYSPLIDEQKKVIDLRCRGFGLYWYQVENELYQIYGSDNRIGMKKAKSIYQEFREDLEPYF